MEASIPTSPAAPETFLALDTGSPIVSVAVASGPTIRAQSSTAMRHSSERLIGMVSSVLGTAGCTLSELAGVLVLRGPGSFTGLRVGLSTVLGFHQALGIRVAAVPTLRILAESVSVENGAIVAAVDALRDEWFVQRFDRCAGPHQRANISLRAAWRLDRLLGA